MSQVRTLADMTERLEESFGGWTLDALVHVARDGKRKQASNDPGRRLAGLADVRAARMRAAELGYSSEEFSRAVSDSGSAASRSAS